MLKGDSSLFARLLVIAQVRHMDMREVLKYELGPMPWSLACVGGGLVKTTKSSLVPLLEQKRTSDAAVGATCYVIDAMAMLQAMTAIPATFAELASKIMRNIISAAGSASRIDLVADQYPTLSIKGKQYS